MEKSKIAVAALILTAMILFVYWPVQYHEFLNFDDQVYVTGNLHVRGGMAWDNVQWAFGSLDAGFWHPLTWLSLMLDSSLYRVHAGGFHWTNVLFHIGSALLIFFTWLRMTGRIWQSGFLAALFAVHPLNVEPVAWIASRKDVLSGFFWALTLWMYVRYVESPHIKRYGLFLLCFLLGLMSKPILVTLPIVLLLLDYWPLVRFDAVGDQKKKQVRLVLEKVPLVLLALAVVVVTFTAEHRFGAISNTDIISLPARISNALVSYLIYIEKAVIPVNLAAYYPHPGTWPLWESIGAGMLILLLSVLAIRKRRTCPHFFVGWFWYLITLVPVIGFIQLGTLARADRYAYIPLIGLFMACVWSGAAYIKGMKHNRSVPLCLALAVLLPLVATSRVQLAHWRNDLSLFQHAIRVTENNYKAYHGLGMAYHQEGEDEQAIKYISHSLWLKRTDRAHIDLGVVYMGQKRFKDAEREFREGLKIKADNAKAHNNLGAALASQGKYEESIYHFQKALSLDPIYQNASENLEKVLVGMKAEKKGVK